MQQILGHSDPAVTQRYSHLNKETVQEASEAASAKLRAAVEALDSPRPGLRVIDGGKN
ncbi:hypothetical protein FE810_15495 [Thalassotalea litorea]|uniref:Tyr recombinase domain-containing protein n=1 Tax=Thalassotalea litorea TaxID=2020715 RepID=A0A5R9IF93_9GAMM|nr:hypothetical protein FE810_15495 [Thalassotalea litorea]